MIVRRPDVERGRTDFGWLDSRHTFSFGEYYDHAHTGFRALRVINEDRVMAGQGFGTHGHRDMEILSYVLDGELSHRDDIGNGSVIVPGDVQRMSAGRGVRHSEFNPSRERPVHFLQIWIIPAQQGIPASYEQSHLGEAQRRGKLALLAAPPGEGGAVAIHQDARVYAGLFDGDESATLAVAPGRRAYVHAARGDVTVNGKALRAGDAAMLENEPEVRLEKGSHAEVLLFDLP